MRNYIVIAGIGFGIGFGVGVCARSPDVDDNEITVLKDSLAIKKQEIAYLDAARLRAVTRATEDSARLAEVRRVVRVVATPDLLPVLPETTTVYSVPAPVAELVTRLETRVLSLEALLDTTNLSLVAERNARQLAESLAKQTEMVLIAERGRKWRYRMEGAGAAAILLTITGGILSAVGGR